MQFSIFYFEVFRGIYYVGIVYLCYDIIKWGCKMVLKYKLGCDLMTSSFGFRLFFKKYIFSCVFLIFQGFYVN